MSWDDDFEFGGRTWQANSSDVACLRCGKDGLEWYDTGPQRVLWDPVKNRRHECPRISAKDEFGPK